MVMCLMVVLYLDTHPYGWETIPTVKQELDIIQECMGEIEELKKKWMKI